MTKLIELPTNIKECPICTGEMVPIEAGDGVKYIRCIKCLTHIHFGSWSIQRKVMEVFNNEKIQI